MTDPDTGQIVFNILVGIVIALIAFITVRLHNRVDSIEESKVDKEWFKDTVTRLDRTFEKLEAKLDEQTKTIVRAFARIRRGSDQNENQD